MDQQALQQKRDELIREPLNNSARPRRRLSRAKRAPRRIIQRFPKRLQAIRRDLQGGLDRDMSDQAIQLENRDTLLEIARVTEQELAQVEQQLAED